MNMRSGRAAVIGLAVLASAGWAGQAVASPAKTHPTPTRVSATRPVREITANWKAFFSGKTSPARKVALLEDGPRFKAIITGQAKLGASASATVAAVTGVKKTTATVRYTILLDGAPALKNQVGTAVLQDGTWKVGDASFCRLLSLEGVKTAACPTAPARK